MKSKQKKLDCTPAGVINRCSSVSATYSVLWRQRLTGPIESALCVACSTEELIKTMRSQVELTDDPVVLKMLTLLNEWEAVNKKVTEFFLHAATADCYETEE